MSVLFCTGQLIAQNNNQILFDQRIRPVLEKKCAACHSGGSPSAGLNMATFDSLLTGGKHGAAIVPGDSKDSLLLQYVRGERGPKMPMGGALDTATIDGLAKSIDQMKAAPASPKKADPYLTWLLHRPSKPAIPAVRDAAWVKNPIDAFILAKLEAKGLQPAPPASKRVWLRRVYFDLIGLPPTPADIDAFQSDNSDNAYEKVVDKLLADPRYGERWGRHWLDLARFAESDGFAIDGERPTAWRYRDYVIRAFNQDKHFDTFVKEQIAGDEMQEGERSEHLVALGFLRMGTWEADANFKTQLRQDVLNELTGTIGQVFLGLTVGCARCHDHKYDPIPQRDFYRLQAFFAPMRVEDRAAPFLEAEHPKLMRAKMRSYEDQSDEANDALKKIEDRLKEKFAALKKSKPDDKKGGDFMKTLKDAKDATFTAAERQEWNQAKDRARKVTEMVARYRPVAYSVSDVVPPQVPAVADTYVLGGGELANKGEKVEPGFPQAIGGSRDAAKIPFAGGSSGRRTALAEWIASADNPLTARVIVNRLWQHHFGEGIVRTPSDFGINGERPTHPELLDWLATQLVEKQWSLKAMHRLMLTSNAYRQSTENPQYQEYAEADPKNQLLWRMNWLRLEGEAVRDSVLAASGHLQAADGGPGVFVSVPADVASGFEFFKWFPSSEQEQARRTIYTFQRRSVMNPMIEVFDGANMSEVCSRRSTTVVPTQAFTLLNSKFIHSEAKRFAERVIEFAGPDRKKEVDEAFRLTVGRLPSPQERAKAEQLLGAAPSREALARLGVVLFNLNEFIYLE
ncbi:MAG TPA: PSD1 and planctomycete cytochrome C domain-containing protein [Bryobacteraceae bacterium]|nr:PSD1 and planctomycete cytochrome C domain-containing protein [Bryobacteraceae bacterium]